MSEITAEMLERIKQRILSAASQPDRSFISLTRYKRIERLARDNPEMTLGQMMIKSYEPYKDEEERTP